MTAPEQEYLPTDLPKEIPAHTGTDNDYTWEDESDYQAYQSVKTLLSWHAPGRPFRKRTRQYYASALLLALLIEVILFLFAEYLLMVVVVSFVFIIFVLSAVPPTNFHYKISTQGITIEDHFYLWQELYDFYFKRREEQAILHIRTRAFFPGEITLVLGSMDKEHIKQVLVPFLPYREVVRQTLMEKAGNWLAKTFPLEKKSPPEVAS